LLGSYPWYAWPSFVAPSITRNDAPADINSRAIARSFGCRPSPNSANICSSATVPPTTDAGKSPASDDNPLPSQTPGDSPFCS
jgi:hypothetical protein